MPSSGRRRMPCPWLLTADWCCTAAQQRPRARTHARPAANSRRRRLLAPLWLVLVAEWRLACGGLTLGAPAAAYFDDGMMMIGLRR